MYRILLIEDDSSLSTGIQYALRNEGFEVTAAGSLNQGAGMFDQGGVDLVLLDVMLPDGTGYDFCRDIRKISDTPVIFLTACDEEVNVVLGLDIGGDDYITKPFRLKELISRINAVLRRRSKRNPDSSKVLISGAIQVFTLEGKIKKNNFDIILTSMEYRLLLSLIKNSGRIMSRNSILEALWDAEGEFVDDNTLSVYIKRLREKIEDNPSQPVYISTVRGMGYRWECEVRGE